MPDSRQLLRLPCPVCETRLELDRELSPTICPVCKAELKIVQDENLARLESVVEPAKLSPLERELVEVTNQIRTKNDNYGAGCAVASIAITLVVCIGIIGSGLLKSGTLFILVIAFGLVISFLVLYLYISSSSRAMLPLVQHSQELQTALQFPPAEPEPQHDKPEPQAQG